MTRYHYFIAGTLLFFITALLYTLERIASYTRWNAQIASGNWSEEPTLLTIFTDNWFVGISLFATIVVFAMAFNEKDNREATEKPTVSS